MMISLDDGGCLRGVWGAIYRGTRGPSSNLSSRIKPTLSNGVRLILRGDGEPTLKQRLTGGPHRLGGLSWGRLAPLGSPLGSVVVVCLLESS
jgi:hypothetical protein